MSNLYNGLFLAVFCILSGCGKNDATITTTPILSTGDIAFQIQGTTTVGSYILFKPFFSIKGKETFLWDFGDGSYSTEFQPPYHQYSTSGNFKVTFVVNNGAEYKISKYVIIKPNYQFNYSCAVPLPGYPISFHITYPMPAGNSYYWDFGDGTTSTTGDTSQSHVYADSGHYKVKLIVNGDTASNSITEVVIVNDPLYTHLIAGTHLWHGFLRYTDAHGTSYGPIPDRTFELKYISPITLSFGYTNLDYVPDSSFGTTLFFKGSDTKLNYDYSTGKTYLFYSWVETSHSPPTLKIYEYEWYTP